MIIYHLSLSLYFDVFIIVNINDQVYFYPPNCFPSLVPVYLPPLAPIYLPPFTSNYPPFDYLALIPLSLPFLAPNYLLLYFLAPIYLPFKFPSFWLDSFQFCTARPKRKIECFYISRLPFISAHQLFLAGTIHCLQISTIFAYLPLKHSFLNDSYLQLEPLGSLLHHFTSRLFPATRMSNCHFKNSN